MLASAPESSSLRLVGGLLINAPDKTVPFLMDMFPRLTSEVKHTGDVARQVQFECSTSDGDCIHFIGIEVDLIEDIPEGMIAWDLQNDRWTVLETKHGQNNIIWQEGISWQWLDQSVPGRPVGEFTAVCPPNWSKEKPSRSREFRIWSNGYLGKGDCDDDIYLADYDPSWPEQFHEMECFLKRNLGQDVALRIEHYGSTSIPNMPAKPVIDILVEILSFDEARKCAIPLFNRPECEYWQYKDHICFILRKEFMGKRTHHIHMAPAGHRIWEGLAFRDYLRTHHEDATRYADLKRELAEKYSTDREAYTDAKAEFVKEVMAKAVEPSRPSPLP